jgi:hypothetical protein
VAKENNISMKALSTAKEYADVIFKGPLGEIGGILSDTVGHWRLKNQVRLLLKTKDWLEQKGVDPKPLLPDIFVPLLQDASNVEDQTLSDMFAALLANHLDSDQSETTHPSYSKVLGQLSAFDAKVMLEFRRWVSYGEAREVGLRGRPTTVSDITGELKCQMRTAYLACLNLYRLGVLEDMGHKPPYNHPIPGLIEAVPEFQQYILTEYGIEFCDACSYPI